MKLPSSFFRWAAVISACLGFAGSVARAADASPATAIFAGGCFWCSTSDFDKLPGVLKVEAGYSGGTVVNPDYKQVGQGTTGHAEAVRVSYDPGKISYAQLVEYFWHTIDPTVEDRQFCDIGNEYRTIIFWGNEAERKIAEGSRDALVKSGRFKHVYTQVVAAGPFYVAEEYHQDYHHKNPLRYRVYRTSCGRDARLAEVWGTK